MKKKMATIMMALVSMTSLALVGCKTNIQWLDEKICDHEEYEVVEVTLEPTCTEEGEHILECLDCGKTKTETIEAIAHTDEDGDSLCDICEKALTATVEVGEKVAGNWYRMYYTGSVDRKLILSNNVQLIACTTSTGNSSGFVFKDGQFYRFEGMEVVETQEYIDVYLAPGSYKYVAIVDSGDTIEDQIEIDETTTVQSVDSENVVRVIKE